MKTRTGNLFKRGDVYYLRWKFKGKPIVKRLTRKDEWGVEYGITTIEEAESARARVMDGWKLADQQKAEEHLLARITGRAAEIAQHEAAHPGLAINQAWDKFVQSRRRPDSGKRTLESYACQWGRFADWMKEKHPALTIRDVSGTIAEEYAVNLESAGMSANTYNKHLALLQMVFRVLAHTKDNRVPANPWTENEIPRKKLAPHSRRELTVEELQAVCAAAKGEMRTLFAIGIYTGLRLGDCATLRWGETDLLRGRIVRVPNKTGRRDGKTVTVPLHRSLAAMLAETPRTRRKGDVLPETAALYRTRPDVLTKQIGALFHACNVQTASSDVSRAPRMRIAVEVGFHSLRHTFVSLCRASNVPLAVVEAIVGHSNPAMTRHYTHTGEDAARLAVASLPLLGAPGVTRPTPAERVARLLAKVEKTDPATVKRAVLRLLRKRAKELKKV